MSLKSIRPYLQIDRMTNQTEYSSLRLVTKVTDLFGPIRSLEARSFSILIWNWKEDREENYARRLHLLTENNPLNFKLFDN